MIANNLGWENLFVVYDPIYGSWLKSPKTLKQVLPVPSKETEAKQLLNDTMARYDFGGGLWPGQGSYIAAGHAEPPLQS